MVTTKNLVLPKIEVDVLTQEYGRFRISPLEGGYGVTLGNALRRVLLSSLPGIAVTSMAIEGVPHEFSTIPYAREDAIMLMLNAKQIRMKASSPDVEGPFDLFLEVRGEGVVTAGDLRTPPEIEIVNPELPLLTIDSPDAELDIHFTADWGRGFSPARDRKVSIGEIPIDAIFSPVRKVAYNIEPTRIGQMTNYDLLSLEVWTDGTIEPFDALKQAAEILIRHLSLIVGGEIEIAEEEEEPFFAAPRIPDSVYNETLEHLGLSLRAHNALKRSGIELVGQVLERLAEGRKAMLDIKNFGEKSLDELLDRLSDKGYLKYVPRKALDDLGVVSEEEEE